MENTKQQNHMLFCLQALACFSVVMVHCSSYPGLAGDVVNLSSRFAVPIFYMTSGYYLYRPGMPREIHRERLRGKIRHVFRLTVSVSLLYLCYLFVSRRLLEGASFKGLLMQYFNLRESVMWLLFNRVTFASHLWFLYGLLYVYVALYLLSGLGNRRVDRLLCADWFGPALLAAGILLRFFAYFSDRQICYFALADVAFYRNWLFMGLPFVLIGCRLRAREQRLCSLGNAVLVGLTAAGTVLMILEWRVYVFLFQTYPEVYLGTILATAALFTLALRNPMAGCGSLLAAIGRRLAMPVYAIHIMVSWIFRQVYLAAGGHAEDPWYFWGRAFWVLGISLGVSALHAGVMRLFRLRKGR